MDDHPPIARLIKAQVLFDTTVPRYFAVINECSVLRRAFPRALITTGVRLELEKARRPVRASGGDLGPLLDDPPWAELVELTGSQIVDVEQLRLAFHSPQELLEKETTDLGEFETIVASQALGGLPIVMEDSIGARVGHGRGLACYQAIVLAEVGAGSWQPECDATPWIRFILTAHYRQALTLLRRTEESERRWTLLQELTKRLRLPERTIGPLFNASMGLTLQNARYRSAADVSELVASRDLKSLVEAGLLEARGEKRGRVYVRSKDLAAVDDEVRGPRRYRVMGDPFELAAQALRPPTQGL
jgi:DNA-binding transcriptional ArsR family regulator